MKNTNNPVKDTPTPKAQWKGIAGLILVVYVLLMLAFTKLWEWTLYWIYYKPAYALLGNHSLYSSVFVYWLGILLLISAYIIASVLVIKKNWIKKTGIVLMIALTVFISYNIFQEIISINTSKYDVDECNLNRLSRVEGGGGQTKSLYYDIDGTKFVSINMNFYQYTELLKLKKKKGDVTIQVYYLPSRRRMLKYQE
jgi:hypothetical protein